MFIRSVNPVITNALAVAWLGALTARPAAALLATPTLRLFKNSIPQILPAMVIGDFVEADFTGYAASTLPAFIGPVSLPGSQWALHAEGDFLAGSPVTVSGQAYGYYLTDAAGAILYAAELLTDPNTLAHVVASFGDPGAYLSVDIILALSAIMNVQQA